MGIKVVISFPWSRIVTREVDLKTNNVVLNKIIQKINSALGTTKTETITETTTEYAEFDLITDQTIDASSRIATHPLMNGMSISDHMYKEPITYTISGKYSLAGKNGNEVPIYHRGEKGNEEMQMGASITCVDKLGKIQEVFEKIKDEGILCNILTFEYDGDDILYDTNKVSTRFRARKNMALERITWKQHINYMDFTFNFKEIITVENQEDIDTIDIVDGINLKSPNIASFKNIVLEGQRNEIASTIVQFLYDKGYITEGFIKKYSSETGKNYTESPYWNKIKELERLIKEAEEKSATSEKWAKSRAITGSIIAIFDPLSVVSTGNQHLIKEILQQIYDNKATSLASRKTQLEDSRNGNEGVFTEERYEESINLLNREITKVLNAIELELTNDVKIYKISVTEEEAENMTHLNILMEIGNYYYLAVFKFTPKTLYLKSGSIIETGDWNVTFYSSDSFNSNGPIDGSKPWDSCPLKVIKFVDIVNSSDFSYLTQSEDYYSLYCINPLNTTTRYYGKNPYTYLNNYEFWVCKGNVSKVMNTIYESLNNLLNNYEWTELK